VTTAVYIEVNHEDLATVGAFVREGVHRPVFDLVIGDFIGEQGATGLFQHDIAGRK